jgi:hypothetical protein
MSETLFRIQRLIMRYSETTVFDQLSLDIAPGECVSALLIRPCEVRIYLSVRPELVEGFPCASKASTSSARTKN